jgi:hypothetical protein
MNGKILLMLFILFYHKEQVKSKKLTKKGANPSFILTQILKLIIYKIL